MSELVAAPKAEPGKGLTPKDAETLSEYTRTQRAIEIAAILAFFVLCVWLGARVWGAVESAADVWLVAAALLGGYVFADFTSGLVHWGFDTWGSIYTPVLGKAFIRPFREHHFDEKAITRHDFIETNGNNCLVSLFPLAGAFLIDMEPGRAFGIVATSFILALCFATFLTNQFHAWAHEDDPPRLVALLQRWHLILPPEHHAIHHQFPHTSHYNITTGWLNGALNAIGFYRGLEKLITAVTGAQPREDDLANR